MKQIFKLTLTSGLSLLAFLSFAQAESEKWVLECKAKPSLTQGIRITTSSDFNDLEKEFITAKIEAIKDGRVVSSATNAQIGERLPVIRIESEEEPDRSGDYWGMSVSLGRSGSLSMGYDAVADRWYIDSKMFMFSIPNADAECTAVIP